MSEVEVYPEKFGHFGLKRVEVMTVFVDPISSKAPYIGKNLVSRHKCSATGLSM